MNSDKKTTKIKDSVKADVQAYQRDYYRFKSTVMCFYLAEYKKVLGTSKEHSSQMVCSTL
jgi:hypothetical protein